jgi:erythromycin esterase
MQHDGVIKVAFAAIGLAAGVAYGDLQTRADWLREHAAVVSSIDPANEDFSDLEPLAAAIGDARIVQLGESSHSAGATFRAKVRLIKFLHQRMGFDVLVWESGLYDVGKTNDAIRAGGDVSDAGMLGVFAIWSNTEEVAPLWDYARDSWSTSQPLEMTGYDMQFSGPAGQGFFTELEEFTRAVFDAEVALAGAALVREAAAQYETFRRPTSGRGEKMAELQREGVTGTELTEAIEAWQAEARREVGPRSEHLASYRDALTRLSRLTTERAAVFERAHGARRVDFMRHSIVNAREYGTTIYERYAADLPATEAEQLTLNNRGWNRRDTRNAEIMHWLADERFKGRKLIVWAHNGHVMNAYYASDWESLSLEPQPQGMKPVGVFLDEQFGDEVYTIGFTAYEGIQGAGGVNEFPVPAAPEGSLEAALHALGHPHLFLDFRQLDNQPGHWLRQPSRMAIRGYMSEELPDWTRVVDAVFFNDVMTPVHFRR